MAYSQQSFFVNQILSSTGLNKIESNIVDSREIMGEVRQMSSGHTTSSGWQTFNYDNQIYIDNSGLTYFENISGSDYGWRVDASKGHAFVNFHSHLTVVKSNTNSKWVIAALEDPLGRTMLRSDRILLQRMESDDIVVSLSGIMIPTRVSDVGTGHLRLKYYAFTISMEIATLPGERSWVSMQYIDRNY